MNAEHLLRDTFVQVDGFQSQIFMRRISVKAGGNCTNAMFHAFECCVTYCCTMLPVHDGFIKTEALLDDITNLYLSFRSTVWVFDLSQQDLCFGSFKDVWKEKKLPLLHLLNVDYDRDVTLQCLFGILLSISPPEPHKAHGTQTKTQCGTAA